MKTKLALLLNEYGESHQNPTNKLLHWMCVPLIFFTIFGLLRCIPMPDSMIAISQYVNISFLAILLTMLYYLSLSWKLFLAFIPWALVVVVGNDYLFQKLGPSNLLIASILTFALAWVGQFIGHGIEGKKPSFLKDLQFLLIGPAWLLNFIFKIVK